MIELVNQQEASYGPDGVVDLVEMLESREVSNYICRMGDLAVTPTSIITPSGEHQMSHYGMVTFLRKLAVPIPKSYAWNVENEQLLYDINKLLNEDEREMQYRVEDDVVVGFMNPKYQPVEHSTLLNTLDGGNFQIKEIKHAPHFMRVGLVTDSFIDVSDDDRTLLGLEVLNSEISFVKLQSALLMYRVICSNGAIGIGQAHKYVQEQVGRTEESIIESFYTRIAAYEWQFPEIGNALKEMAEQSVGSMMNFVQRRHIVSRDEPIEQDINLDGMNGIMYLLKGIVGKDAVSILEGYNDKSSQYDVYNSITASAKQYPLDKARKVETLGGFIVSYNVKRMAA